MNIPKSIGKAEALRLMLKCQNNGDTEGAHCDADDILCAFLRAQGNDDLVEAYLKVDKWYA